MASALDLAQGLLLHKQLDSLGRRIKRVRKPKKLPGPELNPGKGKKMQAKSTLTENLELSSMRGTQHKVQQMFSPGDISLLRNALQEKAAEFDCWQCAEIIEMFLRSRGYGVSRQAARACIGRLEATNCDDEAVAEELERLALVN